MPRLREDLHPYHSYEQIFKVTLTFIEYIAGKSTHIVVSLQNVYEV